MYDIFIFLAILPMALLGLAIVIRVVDALAAKAIYSAFNSLVSEPAQNASGKKKIVSENERTTALVNALQKENESKKET